MTDASPDGGSAIAPKIAGAMGAPTPGPSAYADRILAAPARRSNRPIPDEPGKRIVGWVVDEEIAGLSDALFGLEEIERRATAAPDLLDALRFIMNCKHVTSDIYHVAMLAVRKAQGGSPIASASSSDSPSAVSEGVIS